jgi:hypothetical protein
MRCAYLGANPTPFELWIGSEHRPCLGSIRLSLVGDAKDIFVFPAFINEVSRDDYVWGSEHAYEYDQVSFDG